MKRSRFTEEQIIAILREQESGAKTADVCRRHGISSATFYAWKAKFGGRCCTSLTMEDSHCESMALDAVHEQAISRPLSHDELVQLQRVDAQAGVFADLGRQGHDLARAA